MNPSPNLWNPGSVTTTNLPPLRGSLTTVSEDQWSNAANYPGNTVYPYRGYTAYQGINMATPQNYVRSNSVPPFVTNLYNSPSVDEFYANK